MIKKTNDTKIIILGGLGEVGKNMYCVMHGDELIIIDAGINFPEGDVLGVDYITASKIDKGSPLKMVYPPENIVVPSPIAIFKNADHMEAAKKFVDYVLSQEAQQKVADAGTVPVRTDVKMPERYNLPTPEQALQNGIKIDYAEILPHKEDTIHKFSNLFK